VHRVIVKQQLIFRDGSVTRELKRSISHWLENNPTQYLLSPRRERIEVRGNDPVSARDSYIYPGGPLSLLSIEGWSVSSPEFKGEVVKLSGPAYDRQTQDEASRRLDFILRMLVTRQQGEKGHLKSVTAEYFGNGGGLSLDNGKKGLIFL
jgi:hypothetical protein